MHPIVRMVSSDVTNQAEAGPGTNMLHAHGLHVHVQGGGRPGVCRLTCSRKGLSQGCFDNRTQQGKESGRQHLVRIITTARGALRV